MKTHLHRPTDNAKKLKQRFREGDLDLPERRKRCTSSQEEGDVTTNMCPCGTAIKVGTHIVGKREIYKEERDAFEEEMTKFDVCDMEEFCRIQGSEKTIVILGDRRWPQTAK